MPDARLPYHLAQLASLCRESAAAEKVVFVPSRQIGYNLGTALARAGVSWVNLRLTTPAAWAERLVGASLRAEGWKPLVQDADAFFVLSSVEADVSDEARSAGGIAKTLLKTIRALRLAGVAADDVAAIASVSDGVGARLLVRHYAAYGEWLENEKIYDRALLFRRASEARRGGNALFAILDETPLPECAFEFVNACCGGRIWRIGREMRGTPLPEHAAGVRFSEARLLPGDGRVGPGGLMQTGDLGPDDGDQVLLRRAVGVENEVRGVLRELVAADTPLDDVEIIYASESPYLSLLVEESERLGLPMTFAAGVPVTYTRPGQALLGYLRWIASGFDPAELVRLFRSRLVFLGAQTLDTASVGGMLLEARVGPGRSAWRTTFQRYIDRLEDRLEATDSEGGRRRVAYRRDAAGRVFRMLESLYALCPEGERTTVGVLATSGAAFLKKFAAWDGDLDRSARESLVDRLEDLAAEGASAGRTAELSAILAELVQGHKVEAAVARPGHVYAVPLERAGYSGRRETAILGLAETTFPGPALEDPILLDAARERFGGRLKLERRRVGEPAYHLLRAMGAAAGRVILTANGRDMTDGREVYPAALFEQAKEQMGVGEVPVYGPIPDPEAALTSIEAALALRFDAATKGLLKDEFGWLVRGRQATVARGGDALGPYDGWLGSAAAGLRPEAMGVLSASRLEDLAACPYRYFLKNVLYIRPPDVPEDMPGRWLTPLEFGSLLHEVLKVFMERLAERGETVDAERHEPLMAEVLESLIGQYLERIPVQFDAGYRADRHRLERAARIFLREESRREARPVGFEVSFGMGRSEGLAVPDPVELRLGDGITLTLRGAIDRVDRGVDGYEVWDYKTGSTYGFEEFDLLSGGRRLQWALYAYVLEDLLQHAGESSSVRRSGYFFTSDREHGLRLAQAPPARGEITKRLKPLFDMAGKGAFLHVQKSNACTYCDYAEVCSSERRESKHMDAIVDAADPEHDFVADLSEWMDYET